MKKAWGSFCFSCSCSGIQALFSGSDWFYCTWHVFMLADAISIFNVEKFWGYLRAFLGIRLSSVLIRVLSPWWQWQWHFASAREPNPSFFSSSFFFGYLRLLLDIVLCGCGIQLCDDDILKEPLGFKPKREASVSEREDPGDETQVNVIEPSHTPWW